MSTRVLHLLPSLKPAATVEQLRLLVGGRPAGEFEHHICAIDNARDAVRAESLAPAQVSTLGRLRSVDLRAWRRMKALVGELRPDVLHTWSLGATATGCLGRQLAFEGQLIATLRRAEARQPWPLNVWQGRQLARVDTVVVRDRYAAAPIAELAPATNTIAIADGVPVPSCSLQRAKFCRELGLPAEARLVVTVARFEHPAALRDAIWAIDLLKVIRPDVFLLIVGDGPERQRLLRYVAVTRLGDRVRFLGHRADLDRWLAAADVYVQPGCPTIPPWGLLQAMAAGVPFVAADCPSARRLIAPADAKQLVARQLIAPGDRAALAREVKRLLDDATLAQTLGVAGVAAVGRLFPVRTMIDRYHALYRQESTGR